MFKQLDWYRKMMAGILIPSLALLLWLFGTSTGSFFLSDWFLDILLVPSLFGGLLSSAGYVGRSIDAVSSPKQSLVIVGTAEKVGTVIGLALGLACGVALIVAGYVVPFIGSLGVVADVVFCLGVIGTFSGIGNRLGSCADKHNSRPVNEKRAIGSAAIFGAVLAVALLALKITAVVSIVGVTSFLTGGAALPLWIGGAIFVTNFSSVFASSADYLSKGRNYLNADLQGDKPIDKLVKSRKHEYRGAFAGVSTGLIVAAVVIAAIMISQPYLLGGVVALVAAVAIIATCVSVLGGLFSRCGRLYDTYSNKKLAQAAPLTEKEVPVVVVAAKLTVAHSSLLKISAQPTIASLPPEINDVPVVVGNPDANRDRISAAALTKAGLMASSPIAAVGPDSSFDLPSLKAIAAVA